MTDRIRTRRQGKHQITLARALSKLGLASRSQARNLIRTGRISVNNSPVRSPDLWVDLRVDRVKFDGKPLKRRELVYLALNKPAGVVTTRSDERGRATVYDLLPESYRRLFPVGRLDKETSGLLLLTNDTVFGERVTNPLEKIPKTYRVTLDMPLALADQKAMESPLVLPSGAKLLPAEVSRPTHDPSTFEITIWEGKNRQIRKVCEMRGYRVLALTRLSIGRIRLGNLGEGKIRPLSDEERLSILSFPPTKE